MATILLAEDDQTIRMTVEFALVKAGYEVTAVADGETALQAAYSAHPDLILLDLMLPRKSGFEVASDLRAHNNNVPIIMVTALDQEQDKIHGLDAGADDYITKPFSVNELLARIRANLRRAQAKTMEHGSIITAGEMTIDVDNAVVTIAGKPVSLRNKEYRLLVAMAQRRGALCTRQWLSEEVWGESFVNSSRTIDTHVRRVRKAIDADGWTYIQTVQGMGYRFEPRNKTEADTAQGEDATAQGNATIVNGPQLDGAVRKQIL